MPRCPDTIDRVEYLESSPMRLDKWLWAARLFKTRSLAAEAADRQRICVNDMVAKPAKELRVGDRVALRVGAMPVRTVVVLGLCSSRGPASVAQTLYQETPQSKAAREQAAEARRLAPEPAAQLEDGRPTKRDRRQLDRAGGGWQRWSASLDER
jgi:ribosome-associated heat shock protein Hsp15